MKKEEKSNENTFNRKNGKITIEFLEVSLFQK
jgi:hypothetical protein